MNNFNEVLQDKVKYIENIIYDFNPVEEGYQKTIFEAVNYSITAGGKRLRPMLLMETAKLFSNEEKQLYPFVAAIEMIHTYSLVHDDLPAMDNDMYRRGKKTTHAVYGEDMAILAGDGLLNLAYEVMSQAVVESDEPTKAAKAMSIIAKKAGIYGMVGGQTVDVLNENKEMDLETIEFIHKLKTAALIEASMMAGAVLAGADESQVAQIERVATNIGMAFQIQDDILDVTSTTEVLGKPVLSDEKNNKTTFVGHKGIEESKVLVEKYSNEALDILETFGNKNEFLRELIIKLINREK